MCLQVVRKTRLWQRNIVKRGVAGDSHLPIPASGGILVGMGQMDAVEKTLESYNKEAQGLS